MAAREELVRVECFDELRPGMLVVVKPCSHCGDDVSHRGILGNPMDSPYGKAFPHYPPADCYVPGANKYPSMMVCRVAVDHGHVYRVVIPDAESDSSHASRRDRLLEEVTK